MADWPLGRFRASRQPGGKVLPKGSRDPVDRKCGPDLNSDREHLGQEPWRADVDGAVQGLAHQARNQFRQPRTSLTVGRADPPSNQLDQTKLRFSGGLDLL